MKLNTIKEIRPGQAKPPKPPYIIIEYQRRQDHYLWHVVYRPTPRLKPCTLTSSRSFTSVEKALSNLHYNTNHYYQHLPVIELPETAITVNMKMSKIKQISQAIINETTYVGFTLACLLVFLLFGIPWAILTWLDERRP